MAADRQSGRQGIYDAEAATMGGSGGYETVRHVCVDGQGLAHEVSGMSAKGVPLVPVLSRAGGRWGFPHHHGSQLVLAVRRPIFWAK